MSSGNLLEMQILGSVCVCHNVPVCSGVVGLWAFSHTHLLAPSCPRRAEVVVLTHGLGATD